MMERTRLEQIPTEMRCPLCGALVEIGIREKGYYGHCESREDVPEGAVISGSRRFGNKTRYHYRFPGYIPHCSNKSCFLYSANKMFRSEQDAKMAWEEKTMTR